MPEFEVFLCVYVRKCSSKGHRYS